MFSKLISRRAPFSVARKSNYASNQNWLAANMKFPEGTVAGLYKKAAVANSEKDIVRFDGQKYNWTLKEFDVSKAIVADHKALEA